MKRLKVLLVGQPNVGKSSLLNALVGPKVTVSNYPGTTVEVTQAKKVLNHTLVEFEDTPGIYSVSDRSEEEKITEKALFEKESDVAVILADCTSLKRSLYFALQILEAGKPAILALNFVEEARKKGIEIDDAKLQSLLGIPVVSINPLTKKGTNRLKGIILGIKERKTLSFITKYRDKIEKAINKISVQIKETLLPKRFVALRILEGDEDFYKYLKDLKIIEEIKKEFPKLSKAAEDISITRYGTASFIARKATKIILLEELKKEALSKRVDKILLHNIWGPLLTILFFLIIFGILLFLGNWIQGGLIDLAERALSLMPAASSIFVLILEQALGGLAAGVSIALPYVFLFYLLLSLMEDIGLLSRFLVNLQRFFKRLDLPGKSFIPLILGLGCTVPATRACRILSTRKEKICTASLFTCMPCSSRISIIMGVVGYFGGIYLAFLVFITLAIAFLIWAFLIKRVVRPKPALLLLELPPYRIPLLKNIVVKSWIRMKDFVYIVMPLLFLGGAVYAILDMIGATNFIVTPLSPITWWLGLPAITIIPLVFGFLQKDLTGPMLLSVLGSEIALALSPLQIYTFGLAASIGIPCIIALGMFIREIGFRKAILLTIASITYGFLFTGLAWRVISIF